jgi:hypothetical protein
MELINFYILFLKGDFIMGKRINCKSGEWNRLTNSEQEFVKKGDEVIDALDRLSMIAIKEFLPCKLSDMSSLDEKELEMYNLLMGLYKDSVAYVRLFNTVVVENANQMNSIDRKIDKILGKLYKKEMEKKEIK